MLQEQVVLPDVNAFDWSEAREQAKQVDRERYLVGGFIEMGIFERIYLLMGLEDTRIWQISITKPRLIEPGFFIIRYWCR